MSAGFPSQFALNVKVCSPRAVPSAHGTQCLQVAVGHPTCACDPDGVIALNPPLTVDETANFTWPSTTR